MRFLEWIFSLKSPMPERPGQLFSASDITSAGLCWCCTPTCRHQCWQKELSLKFPFSSLFTPTPAQAIFFLKSRSCRAFRACLVFFRGKRTCRGWVLGGVWKESLRRMSETPTTTTSQKSIAVRLPFVLQYASHLYCSAFGALTL